MIINKPTEYHTGWDGMSISVDTENVMCPLLWGTKPGNVQNQGYHFSVDVYGTGTTLIQNVLDKGDSLYCLY